MSIDAKDGGNGLDAGEGTDVGGGAVDNFVGGG